MIQSLYFALWVSWNKIQLFLWVCKCFTIFKTQIAGFWPIHTNCINETLCLLFYTEAQELILHDHQIDWGIGLLRAKFEHNPTVGYKDTISQNSCIWADMRVRRGQNLLTYTRKQPGGVLVVDPFIGFAINETFEVWSHIIFTIKMSAWIFNMFKLLISLGVEICLYTQDWKK